MAESVSETESEWMGFSLSVGVCGDDMEAGTRLALLDFLRNDSILFVPTESEFLNFLT